jgi:hypothetical protein
LLTGNLSGNIWSANCGWISLSNAVAYVQTDTLAPSQIDTNGLPIACQSGTIIRPLLRQVTIGILNQVRPLRTIIVPGRLIPAESLACQPPLHGRRITLPPATVSAGGKTGSLPSTAR